MSQSHRVLQQNYFSLNEAKKGNFDPDYFEANYKSAQYQVETSKQPDITKTPTKPYLGSLGNTLKNKERKSREWTNSDGKTSLIRK